MSNAIAKADLPELINASSCFQKYSQTKYSQTDFAPFQSKPHRYSY